MRAAAIIAMVLTLAPGAYAQSSRPGVNDTRDIEDCIKSSGADVSKAERCIGIVSEPCLNKDKTRSTADMNACIDRERLVWDDILNETYRRLSGKLDAAQKGKLRDMQRAWIASRDKTCAFYWDYFQGTMASPMGAGCVNRETARRALFLLGFLNDAEGK
ncbi:MAG TPA: lysozyme inhibitor LprI family protein [Pseudolabrys sp.]|nr:lysozyme inhibitor LprI family protein [Pseudolabrys sp.]